MHKTIIWYIFKDWCNSVWVQFHVYLQNFRHKYHKIYNNFYLSYCGSRIHCSFSLCLFVITLPDIYSCLSPFFYFIDEIIFTFIIFNVEKLNLIFFLFFRNCWTFLNLCIGYREGLQAKILLLPPKYKLIMGPSNHSFFQ